jgi:D-alanyl-D-alanine carboxypeptidase/D-alanyl-D-alanine-endopeptidase (penicillin-binding protein 4)
VKSRRILVVWVMWIGLLPTGVRAEDQTVIGLSFKPLSEILHAVVSDPNLEGARVGVRVEDVETGRTLFAHNPDWLINPASVTKVFTTAAALCLLHPDYRFKTEVYMRKRPDNGVVAGPLYLKGYGDPFLVNERITYLANELKTLGLEKIEGPLVLDDSFFDGQGEGPGWSQDDSSRPYQAPMGALSLNFNSVTVTLFAGEGVGKPARVELHPDSDHFLLINRVVTSHQRTWIKIDADRMGKRTRVVVRGRVNAHHPGSRHQCRVTLPTWYTGYSFFNALKSAGVRARTSVRRGAVPNHADLYYTLRSPALGELVRKVNKLSQNFMAEQLLKTLGAEFLGEPGSWYKGQQVMNAFLDEEVGIPPGTYILHNGSGLNDVNRVTVTQVVKLLHYMWGRFDVRPDFLASLAVAGADGTVNGRFAHPTLARTMRLKTGSLENVRALTGYIHSRGKQVFAFAFLVSDYQCHGYQVSHLIDRFASALARADRNLQVIEEVEIEPVEPEADPTLITPAGPPQGPEEADIPRGEP